MQSESKDGDIKWSSFLFYMSVCVKEAPSLDPGLWVKTIWCTAALLQSAIQTLFSELLVEIFGVCLHQWYYPPSVELQFDGCDVFGVVWPTEGNL